jgi:heme/copper-type cytochrome/quinol oxidase subunit 2
VSHEALNACADACKSSLNSNTRKIIARPFDSISPSVNQNKIIIVIVIVIEIIIIIIIIMSAFQLMSIIESYRKTNPTLDVTW